MASVVSGAEQEDWEVNLGFGHVEVISDTDGNSVRREWG